jgi:lipopolysaccharide biosynthesis regulator YciM
MYAHDPKLPVVIRALLTLLLLCLPAALTAQDGIRSQDMDPELAQRLMLAEGHHDLAVLYIKKGDFDKAAAAAREIMRLGFTGEYEKLVSQSFAIITERLAEAKRFDLAQALLDEALKTTEQNVNRVRLLKNKARIFVLSGENDRAIDSWKKALDLEQRSR